MGVETDAPARFVGERIPVSLTSIVYSLKQWAAAR